MRSRSASNSGGSRRCLSGGSGGEGKRGRPTGSGSVGQGSTASIQPAHRPCHSCRLARAGR
eukprot:14494471-Alexandrium_andersonii.AAC.1